MNSAAQTQYDVIQRRLATIIDASSNAGGWRVIRPTWSQFQQVAGNAPSQPEPAQEFLQLAILRLTDTQLGELETALMGLQFDPRIEDSGDELYLRIYGKYEVERLKGYLGGRPPSVDIMKVGPSPERKFIHIVFDMTQGADRTWNRSTVNGHIVDYRVSLHGMNAASKKQLILSLEMLGYTPLETKVDRRPFLLIQKPEQIAQLRETFELDADYQEPAPDSAPGAEPA